MLRNISENIKTTALTLSYDAERDPLVLNLKKALDAINDNNWRMAKNFITAFQVKSTIENRIIQYSRIPAFKNLKTDYDSAVQLVERQDQRAIDAINLIIDAHKKSKQQIETLQGLGTRP
jgi:hypothetical protein